MLDAGLADGDRLGDEVVEATAGGRDGDVVLVVDPAEVPETSLPL